MFYRQCSNITSQTVDDEALLLDVETNQIHQLNPTACFIWSQCDGSTSVEQIADIVVERFEVERSAAINDIERILQQLDDLKLIERISEQD
ncbi:MAG: PqqD family protein [Pseudomonadota bacterium]|nr:MAG: PqqD family protein [Pseudomonadota bacterium]